MSSIDLMLNRFKENNLSIKVNINHRSTTYNSGKYNECIGINE
jgi:hypothetical protein